MAEAAQDLIVSADKLELAIRIALGELVRIAVESDGYCVRHVNRWKQSERPH